MTSDPLNENRYIPPGTKVRLEGLMDDNDQAIPEFGIAVHCWEEVLGEEGGQIRFYDCYVAFFGEALPLGKPAEKPYVLRYAANSLTTIP